MYENNVLGHISLKNKQCVKNTQLTFSQLGSGGEEETVNIVSEEELRKCCYNPCQVKL